MAAEGIMSDDEGLPNTLTPMEGNLGNSQGQETTNIANRMPWGRLIACKTFLRNVDLVDPFIFGRGEDCSVVITPRICPPKIVFTISKKHFRIDKCPEDNLVYITDLSKNGTFVNKQKLSTGQRKILKKKDEISTSMAGNSLYLFLSMEGNDDFLPAELANRFANVCRLGHGSCGEVRLVKDCNTLKTYAVKKIILSESNSSQIHKINHPTKVNNEIAILKKLSHPCVIGMSDILHLEKEVYLILEYMAGGELTKRIRNYPMPEDLIKFYFIQMILATAYLHSNGVIHRDLKPENILLQDNRQETLLKISDFGLSKITDQDIATTMCGTLLYVAPEVINRKCVEYGKEVDIWSLGVILYFMISKDFPFKGNDDTVIARNILKGHCEFPGEVWSDASKDLIKKMLQLRPQNRIKISEILNHDWIKYDYGVKIRVQTLLKEEGLPNSMQEILLEPEPKKFKFNNEIICSSSSSDESNTTLTSRAFHSSPTICC